MHATKALLMGLCVVLTTATDTLARRPSLRELEQRVTALEQAPRAPYIVDAIGQVVGVVLEEFSPPNDAESPGSRVPTVLLEATVLLDIRGIPAVARVTPLTITGFPPRNRTGHDRQLNFDRSDCAGTAYVIGTYAATFGGRALVWNDNIYLPKPEPGVNRTLVSRVFEASNGDLVRENASYRTVFTEALTLPLSIFDGFVPPFSLSVLPSLP